jgi:DNA-binding PadR family transcriptional regulator
MPRSVRMTASTLAVLRVLAEDPTAHLYGREIGKASGLASGSLYPILDRLEEAGWVEGHWEEADATQLGRPRRRYYCLTAEGAPAARSVLRDAHARLIPTWMQRPAPPAGQVT